MIIFILFASLIFCFVSFYMKFDWCSMYYFFLSLSFLLSVPFFLFFPFLRYVLFYRHSERDLIKGDGVINHPRWNNPPRNPQDPSFFSGISWKQHSGEQIRWPDLSSSAWNLSKTATEYSHRFRAPDVCHFPAGSGRKQWAPEGFRRNFREYGLKNHRPGILVITSFSAISLSFSLFSFLL